MAITEDRNTEWTGGELAHQPLAASTKVYGGGMAQLVSGYAKPALATQAGPIVGAFDEQVDNSSGAAADEYVHIKTRMPLKWANSETSAVTQAYVGKPCYCEDDQTVCIDASKPFAGIVERVESDGVWVFMSIDLMPTGAAVGAGSWATTQTLLAATALVFNVNQKYYPVAGSGGAVTLISDFPDGSHAGQEIVLVGTHDANTVEVTTGINTKTEGGASITLAADSYLPFVWNGSDWVQSGPAIHSA